MKVKITTKVKKAQQVASTTLFKSRFFRKSPPSIITLTH